MQVVKIDRYKRVQPHLRVEHIFHPRSDGKCACGCGRNLHRKRGKWYSLGCKRRAYDYFNIIKGNSGTIRAKIWERDHGKCKECGNYDENWQADHKIPVHQGGGGCNLSGFQTLCPECHRKKTLKEAKNRVHMRATRKPRRNLPGKA